MRKIMCCVALLITAVILLSACGRTQNNSFVAKDLEWTKFTWNSHDFGDELAEKAGIRLPVTIDGQSEGALWVQLDTGLYHSVFYERPFKHLNERSYKVVERKNGQPSKVQFDGALGGLRIERAQVEVKQNYGMLLDELEGDVKIGTIGLDLFVGKVLVLDFPNSQMAVINSIEQLPPDLSQAEYIPATIEQGWFIVGTKVGNMDLRLVYDSGSSPFALVVKPQLWEQLTGRAITHEGLKVREVPRWGDIVTLVGAPIKGQVHIGKKEFGSPDVYDAGPMNIFTGSVDGLLGNALFYDNYTIILDLKNMRFGFAKTR